MSDLRIIVNREVGRLLVNYMIVFLSLGPPYAVGLGHLCPCELLCDLGRYHGDTCISNGLFGPLQLSEHVACPARWSICMPIFKFLFLTQ